MVADLCCLSVEDLARVIAEAKRLLYPEAVISNGQFQCAHCHERGLPDLIEEGIIVTHNLQTIGGCSIVAEGWDGSSSAVSEDGERLLLECTHCFQWHRIPDDVTVEWK